MKRKLLIGLLGVTAAVGVVGSGFSAWYFDVTNLTASNNVTTYVTDLAGSIGELTDNDASKTLCIVLDQGGHTNKADKTKGISFVDNTNVTTVSDDTLGAAVSSLSAKYEIAKADYTNLKNAGKTSGTFTAEFKLSETADDYIQFDTSYAVGNITVDSTAATTGLSVEATKLTFTYTVDWSSETADTLTKTFTFDVSTTSYVNKLLQYISKPADKTTYNAMKTALGTSTALTVSYSFGINA